jgi:hypothetical protein
MGYVVANEAAVATYEVGTTPLTDFTVPFDFDEPTDLAVTVGGQPAGFSLLVGTLSNGIYVSGTIRLDATAASTVVVIRRATRLAQTVDLPTSGPLPVAALNREVSRLWLSAQDQATDIAGSLRAPPDETALGRLPGVASRRNRLLGFDSGGAPLAYDVPYQGVTVGNFSLAQVTPANGTAALTLAEQLGYIANVRGHGATGNGSTNDWNAFVAAAASGKPVYVPPGDYQLGTGTKISLSARGQRIFGHGQQSNIISTSSADIFEFTGGMEGGGVEAVRITATAKASGACIAVRNAHRIRVSDVRMETPWIPLYIEKCNVIDVLDLYVAQARGPRGIHWWGDATKRSDILRIERYVISAAPGAMCAAIEMDGNVNTLDLQTCELVGTPGVPDDLAHGIWVRNTTASADPAQFIFAHNFQCDYPVKEGIRLDAGNAHFFTGVYVQGSKQEAGIVVGSAVTGARIHNAYVRGCFRNGVVVGGQDVGLQNCELVFNSYPNIMTYDAAYMTGTARRVLFAGCLLGGMQGVGTVNRWGAYVDAGATSIRFIGCDFYGNLHGDVYDGSGVSTPGNVEVVGGGAQEQVTNERISGWELGIKDGGGATATCTVAGGAITGLTLTGGGSEYSVAPSVLAFDPAGTGSGFAGTATISTAGVVTGLAITAGGTGYSAGTLITIRSANRSPTLKARWPGQPNISARLDADGSGVVLLGNDQGVAFQAQAADAASVNYLAVRARASGTEPDIISQGPAADVDIGLVPKGAGKLKFGALTASADAPIVGYITIKDAGGTLRKLAVIA